MSLPPAEHLEYLHELMAFAGVKASEIVLPEEHHVIARRMRFRYLDWGTRGKPTILFLHGGGLTAHTWDVPCLALRNEYHCLAVDLRGHGDSEWSPEMDYRIEAHRDDVEALVDVLGLSRFALVGMSLGGLAAIGFAGRHAARLAALVLVDVGPETRMEGARRIQEFVAAPAEFTSIDEVVERAMSFNPNRDPRFLRKSLQHNLRQQPNGTLTWKHDRRHRGKFDVEEWRRRRLALWDEVPKITCPTLVVRGARSDVFLDEDAEKLAATLPNGQWVRVENAGHTVQGDNPRGLLESLRPFIEARFG